jgi:hypothetical protein
MTAIRGRHCASPVLILAMAAGCGGSGMALTTCPPERPVNDPVLGCVAPALTQPTPWDYQAVIITNAAHADTFASMAELHTLTGLSTEVVTVQSICAADGTGCRDDDPCNDTAKAIKDYLSRRYGAGLRQVVLGGDLTVVPSRQTSDFYANPILGVSYHRTFFTDAYFADLSAWDANGDCVYGEPGVDAPDYLPELAVTRIPVATPAEADAYVAKVERYLTAYDTSRIGTALFLSNVATQLQVPWSSAPLPVDSALYFETADRTLSLLPPSFAVTKLYSSGADRADASPISVPAQIEALTAGANWVVHAGHGDIGDLTVESDGSIALTAAMALSLQNSQLPIMLSCACDAADFTGTVLSAGRAFVTAPNGGGIGYLGNSTLGLGLAGGMQFIDELLRYAFATPGTTIGETAAAAHRNLPRQDLFTVPSLPVVGSLQMSVIDENAWRWTQKAATYLGDGLVPVYTNTALAPAPSFVITPALVGDTLTLTFVPEAPVTGTLTVLAGEHLYRVALDGTGLSVALTVPGHASPLRYGFASPGTLARIAQLVW